MVDKGFGPNVVDNGCGSSWCSFWKLEKNPTLSSRVWARALHYWAYLISWLSALLIRTKAPKQGVDLPQGVQKEDDQPSGQVPFDHGPPGAETWSLFQQPPAKLCWHFQYGRVKPQEELAELQVIPTTTQNTNPGLHRTSKLVSRRQKQSWEPLLTLLEQDQRPLFHQEKLKLI